MDQAEKDRADVRDLISKAPQSSCTLSAYLIGRDMMTLSVEQKFDIHLERVPRALETLLKEGVIETSHNQAYDCGPGNGLAVEWFYKLKEVKNEQ